MADVFISYAHQDGDVVKELSPALEAAGYTTWYYEDKGAVGASYLRQIDQEIGRCHAMIVVVSPDSIQSDQVSKEVIRAHEAKKKFVPVRRDITHAEFQERQPEWRMAFGAAVSAEVPEEGAAALGPRLVAGLRALGVEPGGPPALPTSPLRRLSRVAKTGTAGIDKPLGKTVSAVVGGVGLLASLSQLSRMASPPPNSREAWLAQYFPDFRQITLFANTLGALLCAALLYGAWRLHRGDSGGARLIRRVALGMIANVSVWVVVALSQFSAETRLDPATRSTLLSATVGMGLVALAPAGLVFALFRRAKNAPKR